MVADCRIFDFEVVLIIVSMLVLVITASVTRASIELVEASVTIIIEVDI